MVEQRSPKPLTWVRFLPPPPENEINAMVIAFFYFSQKKVGKNVGKKILVFSYK